MIYIDPQGIQSGCSAHPSESFSLGVEVLPFSLVEYKLIKKNEINLHYSSIIQKLSEGYPSSERESWPVQIMESDNLINQQITGNWIQSASLAREIPATDLAEKIRFMDYEYRKIHGTLTGRRQLLIEQISNAQSKEELDQITW